MGGGEHAQAPARECLEAAEAEECEEEEEEEEEEEDGGPPPRVKTVIPLVIPHIWLGDRSFQIIYHIFIFLIPVFFIWFIWKRVNPLVIHHIRLGNIEGERERGREGERERLTRLRKKFPHPIFFIHLFF